MRLDGWKSIAAHFGRERSTVIRWASERGMPVYRIPGPGRGSVYALSEELDAWLEADRQDGAAATAAETQAEALAPAAASPEVVPAVAAGPRKWPKAWLAALALLVVASLGAWAISRDDPPRANVLLPADAELADLYLEARSDWAARNPQSIAAAIEKLQRVVAAEPGFAPAYAALADSYVLAREFGSLEDVDAFGRAQSAADTALRIDPGNPDALRALGFIDYWWRGDGPSAARRFRQAIAAAPQSAQSHFWYGNILIDNGDFADGMAELERARLIEPASLPLQVDIAWARWSMGESERGKRELEALRERYPDLATVRDCLAVVYLAEGDIPAFVGEVTAFARLRQVPGDDLVADRLEQTLARDPASVLPIYLTEEERAVAVGERTHLAWPTMIASAAGDRAATLRLLNMGMSRGERWGSAGMVRYVTQRWQGDGEITRLIEALRAESLISD